LDLFSFLVGFSVPQEQRRLTKTTRSFAPKNGAQDDKMETDWTEQETL